MYTIQKISENTVNILKDDIIIATIISNNAYEYTLILINELERA